MPPLTVQKLLDLLEESGGGVQVLDPPKSVRAAWRSLLHVLRSGGHVPDGWHLTQRGRDSGDLVMQLRPGTHPSKRYQPIRSQGTATVSADLTDAHPVIDTLRNQPHRLPASDTNRSRVLLLLQTIAVSLAADGHSIQHGAKETLMVVATGPSSVAIRAWEETGKRWSLRLALAADGPGKDSTTWNDYATQPLEDQLSDILNGIRGGLAAEESRRRADDQARQARREHELEREVTVRRAAAVREQVRRWRMAREIRAHCADLHASGMPASDPWLEWALDYADSIDPLADPPSIPDDSEPTARAATIESVPERPREASSDLGAQQWHPNRRWYHR